MNKRLGTLLPLLLLTTAGLGACGRGALTEPDINKMIPVAAAEGKITVPVDVRYQISGMLVENQPSTLQLAFIPRVAGTGLRVDFPRSEQLSIESGSSAMTVQKADASGIYRRSLIVTPHAKQGAQLQAMVVMDVDGGRYFGVFTIPIGPAQ